MQPVNQNIINETKDLASSLSDKLPHNQYLYKLLKTVSPKEETNFGMLDGPAILFGSFLITYAASPILKALALLTTTTFISEAACNKNQLYQVRKKISLLMEQHLNENMPNYGQAEAALSFQKNVYRQVENYLDSSYENKTHASTALIAACFTYMLSGSNPLIYDNLLPGVVVGGALSCAWLYTGYNKLAKLEKSIQEHAKEVLTKL